MDTLSVVCKHTAHGPQECKMMLRVPISHRGRLDKFDLIASGYQWLYAGLNATRGDHVSKASDIKRGFGMRPRGGAAAPWPLLIPLKREKDSRPR